MLGKESEKTNVSIYEIYIVGERIRTQMHKAGLIKDRRYRLRKYKQCFIGHDAIDWLIKMCHAQSRGEAVLGMRCLQDNGVLHHVVDDHIFKDQTLFYRFSRDDDRYLLRSDLTSFYRGLGVFNSMKEAGIQREFYHRGHLYQEAFYGNDLVDCLTARNEHASRADVIAKCRDLLNFDVIRHVTDDYPFSDDRLMYQFNVDYSRPCLLSDLLHQPSSSTDPHHAPSRGNKVRSVDIPGLPSTAAPDGSSSVDSQPDPRSLYSNLSLHHDESHVSTAATTTTNNNNATVIVPVTDNGDNHHLSRVGRAGSDFDSVSLPPGWMLSARRASKDDGIHVTMARKVVKFRQDEVGYGFALKGSSPCYVHTVDPLGPAAAAGLKVGHYVLSVDGQSVMHDDHSHVGRLVITHTGLLTLIVLAKNGPDRP